jgi:hypothetical protein
MLRRVWLCVALTGCYFGVKEERNIVDHGPQWQAPVPIGEAAPYLEAHQRGTGVEVRVTAKRTCEYRGVWVRDHVTTRSAALKMVRHGEDAVVVLLLAPFVLPITGVVAALRASGDDRSVERQEVPMPPRREPCDSPASGVAVIVTAPEREAITVITAIDGRAYAELGDAQLARLAVVQLAPR